MQQNLFRVLTFCLVLAAIVLLDLAFGLWRDTGESRRLSYLFQSEVAPLETRVKHLLPNVRHQYPGDDRPASDQRVPPDSPRLVRTGPDGLILGSISRNLSAPRSVLFLGGSTTENNEVDEPHRFPYLVGRLLTEKLGTPIDGINAGVRGHTTQESLAIYLNHPAPSIEDAQVVVVMHNINDRLLLALRGSYRSSLQDWSPNSGRGLIAFWQHLLRTVYQNLVFRSNILFVTDRVIDDYIVRNFPEDSRAVTEGSIDIPDKNFTKSTGQFRGNIELLVSVARVRGRTPVLVTQPLGRESTMQDQFNQEIRQIGTKLGILVIDLDREISKVDRRKYFYPDFIHFNNEGSIWAAAIISDALENMVFRGANTTATSKPTVPQDWPCTSGNVNAGWSYKTPLNEIDLAGRYPSMDASSRFLLSQFNSESESRIEIRNLLTGEIRSVASAVAPKDVKHPIWMPSSEPRHIVYGANRGSFETLYRFDLQSQTEEPVLGQNSLAAAIASVGRGGSVYFAGYGVDDKGKATEAPDLYVLRKGTPQPQKLTRTPWEEWRPFVTTDEKHIYYISNRDGSFDIFRMSVEKGDITKIVGSEHDEWDPAVSPDGQWLAYASRLHGNFDIYVLNLTGHAPAMQITSSLEDEWDPRFTPDGRILLYATTTPTGTRVRGACLDLLIPRK